VGRHRAGAGVGATISGGGVPAEPRGGYSWLTACDRPGAFAGSGVGVVSVAASLAASAAGAVTIAESGAPGVSTFSEPSGDMIQLYSIAEAWKPNSSLCLRDNDLADFLSLTARPRHRTKLRYASNPGPMCA